jgi:hypothetical protein
MTHPDRLPEVPGLPQHGDMAINCGPAIVESNGYWVTIRHGGQNKTIMLSGENLLRFAEQARQVVSENE